MMMIRPIAADDLPNFMALAQAAGVGMTSLPANEERLHARITRSVRSLAGELPPQEQGFVFVLQDDETGAIAGTCALECAVGMNEPWYNYRIGTVVHASHELGVYKRHDALFLSNDHTGYSELCTLFLHPSFRGHCNGALLSKSRMLFIAQFSQLFGPVVVAELRGVSDETGRSPFWEGLGRHFFSMDFARADYLTGVGQKAFVAELMPKHPIYIDLLPQTAREVIRQPHADTRPAQAILESEGFRCEGYVDIFDGGPTVQAYTDEIRAVRDSRLLPACVDPAAAGGRTLVSNTAFDGFRAVLAAEPVGGVQPLTPVQAAALGVADGEPVRSVGLYAAARHR